MLETILSKIKNIILGAVTILKPNPTPGPGDPGASGQIYRTQQRILMVNLSVFLIVTIVLGINALEEVNTRESYLVYLNKEIDKDLKELNQLRSDKIDAINAQDEINTIPDKKPDLSLEERIRDISNNMLTYNQRLQIAEMAKEKVLALMLQGSWHKKGNVFGIMSETPLYYSYSASKSVQRNNDITETSGAVTLDNEIPILNELRNWPIFVLIRNAASGVLIGFLMISAAGLGACIYTIRGKQWNYVGRNLFSGLGAGIACYLVVQGDALQYVSSIQSTAFTPATKVFIGFLSGLYANEVYRLLTYLVVSFVNKFAPESDIPLPDAPTPTTNATTTNIPPPGHDTTKNTTQEIAPGKDPNPTDTANGDTVAKKNPVPRPQPNKAV